MNLEKFSLDGKVGLITGAAGLLGREHAIALLEAGAKVILTDISHNNLFELKDFLEGSFSPDLINVFKLDITEEQEILKLKNHLETSGISIDILINNAALDPKVDSKGSIPLSRLENFDLSQWNNEIAVGLTGAFLCSKIFGFYMAQSNNGGVILNIASDLSVFSPDQRLYSINGVAEELQPVKPITYSVIKSGLIGMTRYLSTYWPDKCIRANALSPGGVFNNHNDEFVNKLSALIPLGRMAEKDEYRSAIQFLCSDASSYLTGQNIVMDGGRSVW